MTKAETKRRGNTVLTVDDLLGAARGLAAPLAKVADALKRGNREGLGALLQLQHASFT